MTDEHPHEPDSNQVEAEHSESIAPSVNRQVAEAVADVGVTVLGDAPAVAMGQMYQSLAHSTGLMFHNAVAAQQNMNMASQAATIQGVMQLYGIGPAASAAASTRPTRSGELALLTSVLEELLDSLRGERSGEHEHVSVRASRRSVEVNERSRPDDPRWG